MANVNTTTTLISPYGGKLVDLLAPEGEIADLRAYASQLPSIKISTRAECDLHRSWGAQLIGMTSCPEAKLAREAELCYALVGLPTDYDCWKPHPENVGAQELGALILGNLHAATESALALARVAVKAIAAAGQAPCGCQSTLKNAVWTDPTQVPPAVKAKLKLLLPAL